MRMLCRLICSCLYLGELPAGGTWGSLVGWVLAWNCSPGYEPFLLIALCALGYYFTKHSRMSFGPGDPPMFVLDETCGMILAVLWLPKTLPVYAGAFVVFRILDIAKPWPISVLQRMKTPASIMHDDIAAGLFTNLIAHAVLAIFFPLV